MHPSRLLVATFLTIFGVATLPAQTFESLKGTCTLAVSTTPDQLQLRLQRGTCLNDSTNDDDRDEGDNRDHDHGNLGNRPAPHAHPDSCHTSSMQQSPQSFTGFIQSDLGRDGAHVDAVLSAEPGTLTCSGTIHNFRLTGDFNFTPNAAFAAHLLKLGIQGITSQDLETYALFHLQAANIEGLQRAGVKDIDAQNLIPLTIFHVDPAFVQSLHALGYPTPPAQKVIELKIQKVTPEEVRQFRALGYNPTLQELIRMRIFKITPAFIEDMKKRGFGSSPQDLTIARLVKIRIFKLAE